MMAREVWEGCADSPGDAKKLWEAAAALGRGETHDDMREDSQGVFVNLEYHIPVLLSGEMM